MISWYFCSAWLHTNDEPQRKTPQKGAAALGEVFTDRLGEASRKKARGDL